MDFEEWWEIAPKNTEGLFALPQKDRHLATWNAATDARDSKIAAIIGEVCLGWNGNHYNEVQRVGFAIISALKEAGDA